MKKNIYIYGFLAAIIIAGFLFVEYNKPKDINWYPSYVSRHKIPYGTRVFKTLVSEQWGDRLRETYSPPFDLLQNEELEGTFLFVNSRVNFGDAENEVILDWVSKGNRLFVSANNIDGFLLDTLGLVTQRVFDHGSLEPVFEYTLLNDASSSNKVTWNRDYSKGYFIKIDTTTTKTLGTVKVVSDTSEVREARVNFVRSQFGKGEILLHLAPESFTNYFLLNEKNNLDYTAQVASYLHTDDALFLDAYYKRGKTVEVSPMRIFLDTTEFKWAYYLALIGALLYIIFQGRRKQRAIPVIPPLTNQSLNFTRTIGDMYYEGSQRKSIASHKIEFFLEYIRTQFYLPTEKIDSDFIKQLAARSQHTPQQIEQLFQFLQNVQEADSISDPILEQLENRIQNFKAQAHGIQ